MPQTTLVVSTTNFPETSLTRCFLADPINPIISIVAYLTGGKCMGPVTLRRTTCTRLRLHDADETQQWREQAGGNS